MNTRGWFLVGAAGLLVLAFASSQVWFETQVISSGRGSALISVAGSDSTRLTTAAALLAGAALLGGLIGATAVRRLAAVLLITAGVLGAIAVLTAVTDPESAVQSAVTDRTGVVGATEELAVQVTAWPWSALTGAVCLVGAGVLRLITGAQRSERERDARTEAPTSRGVRRGDWERLSEGEDPTEDADAPGPGPEQDPGSEPQARHPHDGPGPAPAG